MHLVDSIEHQRHSSFIVQDRENDQCGRHSDNGFTDAAAHPITALLPSTIDLRNVSRLTNPQQDTLEANVILLSKTLNI